MAEIRLQIPDEMVANLQSLIGTATKATDIAKDALTLFSWAVNERAQGNVILSSDQSGDKMTRITMPSLESVKTDATRTKI